MDRIAISASLLSAALALTAAGRDSPVAEEWFEKTIHPLLETFCFDCHADGANKGDVDFDAYPDFGALSNDWDLWARIDSQLASHVMPPAKKAAPTREQRETLRRFIDEVVFYVDPERPDPGPIVVRRLNRAEYNNTIRDLFRVDLRPADAFPPDDAAHGFDHIGNSFSTLLLEKHIQAGNEIAAAATRLRPIPQAGELARDLKIVTFKGQPERKDQLVLIRETDTEVGMELTLPAEGLYRVKVRAGSDKPDGLPAKLTVLDAGEPVVTLTTDHEYKGRRQYWDASLALVSLKPGKRRFSLRLANPGRTVAIHTFAIQGPFAPTPPQSTPFLDWLTGGRALGTPILGLSGEDFERGEGKSSLDTGKSWFSTNGYRQTRIALTENGRYRFRVKAGAQQAGDEPVKFELRLGDRVIGSRIIEAAEQQADWYEIRAEVDAGEHELQVWFVNELLDDEGKSKRLLWLHEMEVAGPLDAGGGLTVEELPPLMEKAGRMIFRRPLTGPERSEVTRLAGLPGLTPMEKLRRWIRTSLVSPKLLFLGAAVYAGGEAENGSAPVDEFSLASRLSYFLWSSCPDEELLELAEQGKLRAEFDAQVGRMLADPKAGALTENFAGQWLELRDLADVRPDPERFPDFDRNLAESMRRETEALFRHLLDDNRSVLEFLTADYTFADERLAAFYELEPARHGVVSLTDTPRRGLLTHAGILTLTSHPTRTSPVNRGVFVLDKLLGTPPPPAPGNVPPLEETKVDAAASLRDQLEAHRENARCASCHAFLDPIGLGLENFDAIGRWRDTDNGRPIDASGKLVSGEVFANFSELQQRLIETQQQAFVENLTRQLLTYALGRGLEIEDKLAVREIIRRAQDDENRFQSLIHAICESVPFQRIRTAESG